MGGFRFLLLRLRLVVLRRRDGDELVIGSSLVVVVEVVRVGEERGLGWGEEGGRDGDGGRGRRTLYTGLEGGENRREREIGDGSLPTR